MLKFAKQIVSALILVSALSTAVAQPVGGPGPGPVPDPWINNGGTLYYDQGGLTLPSTVSGGSKGVGTINAQGLYVNGVPVFNNAGTVIFASRVNATIISDQNNWTPTGTGSYASASAVFVDGGLGNFNITGLTGGTEGRFIWLWNSGATNNIIVKNQSASSTATNRFLLTSDLTLPPNMGVALRYDATAGRWREGDFYPMVSPTFTGTITGQSLVLTGPSVTMPLVNVTGDTAPANGIYLSAANSLGFATNGVIRSHLGPLGSLFWDGSPNAAAIINQASSSTAPTFAPDQAHTDSGVGGTGGAVSIISNGVGIMDFSSVTAATTGTPGINTNSTRVATTFYADRAASLKMVDNGSAAFVLNLQPADGVTTLTEPYVEGQVIEFTAPICANAVIIPPSGNTYLILDPAGANLLQCSAVTNGNVSDLKPNSRYQIKWHVAATSHWQLITPPQAETYNTPIVSQRYLQGNNDDFTLITTFKPRIFDTHLNQWKYTQFGNTTADIRNTYLYGVPGQALTVNHLYYVYEFTPASAPLGPGGVTDTSAVVLDFDDHYWNGAVDTATNFNASIAGGTMTVLDTGLTNLDTAINNPTLHFASTPAAMKCVIPSDVGCGKTLSNLHSGHEASIPAGTTILSSDATTVTMSKNVVSIKVSSGDEIMAINGKLEVGQPVVGGTVTPGSCITSGGGKSWTVTLTTTAAAALLTANNAHYYPGQDGIQQFINCSGNLETFVGMAFIQQRLSPGTTNAPTAALSDTLHFAVDTVPISIVGLTATDATHGTAIPPGTTVLSTTSTTVKLSAAVAAPGVSTSDVINFTTPSVNTIWNRTDAKAWGILPGNNTSSSPFSMMPQQPIVMFTPPQAPVTGSVASGALTPGTILTDSFELGGSNTESTFISYDWAALNDVNPRTVVTCGAGSSGATVVMQVTQTPRAPLFGGGGETVVFEQSQICATASATVVFDSAIGVDWGDGSFLNKIKTAVSAGVATFSATPMQRALY